MDKASIGGVLLAIAGIVAGLLMEGGNLGQILQPTAALIVFGGTMGAVLLQFPLTTVAAAFRSMAHVFAAPRKHNDELIRLLVAFANKARRNGVVSLDADLQIDPGSISQADRHAGRGRHRARGPAQDHAGQPRLHHRSRGAAARGLRIGGRIFAHNRNSGRGAGLIQVMQHLDNIQEVGRGIAVAFVATIYGVGIANLFFLPLAGKMRIRVREEYQRREMMLEGVISILEGMNPRMLEVKLTGFLDQPKAKTAERAA